MTAEVSILSKTAVALATDSAVTISAVTGYQKIYESADKLFELSSKQDARALSVYEILLPGN